MTLNLTLRLKWRLTFKPERDLQFTLADIDMKVYIEVDVDIEIDVELNLKLTHDIQAGVDC